MAFEQSQNGSNTQSTTQGTPKPAVTGLAALRANSRLPFSRQLGGESLVKFQKAMHGALLDLGITEEDGYDLIQVDCNQNALAVSASLLVRAEQVGTKVYASVFTYLIEASAGRLVPRTFQSTSGVHEIPVTVGDLFDDLYWDRVRHIVITSLGVPEIEVLDGGAMVIPTNYNFEDIDGVIRTTAYYGIAGILSSLDYHLKAHNNNFNVGAIGKRDRLVAHMEYNPDQVYDAAGNPVRTDVAITVSGIADQPTQAGQAPSPSAQQRTIPLVRVAGFVDLIYHQKTAGGLQIDQMQQMMMMQAGVQLPQTSYVPRFVQTLNEAYFDEVSLETILFGFLAVDLLNTNLAWTHVFKPRYGVDAEHDLRDVGALGYEVQLHEAGLGKIDTRSSTFTSEKLADILRRSIAPEMVFSVDIPEVGEMSVLNDVFRAAAMGYPEANRQLIAAADHMLCGKFSEFFPAGAPFVINDDNRIPLGVYHDGESVRDLRDLDYLAMLNICTDTEIRKVMDWSSSNDDTNIPEDIRLDTRCRLINATLNDPKILGWARRVTISAQASKAMAEAFRANGLMIAPENLVQINATAQRGNAIAVQAARGPQMMGTGIFSMQQPQYQQGGQGYTGRHRWG